MEVAGEPRWVTRARREIGQKEVDGPVSNPRIVEYHSHTKLSATDDTIPWCSSFMCWVFENEGIPSTKSAAANSWLDWGDALEKPVLGCIVVLKRSGTPSSAHVGLYVGETPGHLEILGGNQSNQVNVQTFSQDIVLGYRMPDPRYMWEPPTYGRPVEDA